MATSKPYILGGQSFETEVNADVSTVKRISVVPYTQQEVNSATASGNLNSDGTINYANVYGKGNYEQLAAPNDWMNSLSNDPTYWNTISQTISGENPDINVDPNLSLTGGTLTTNTDANLSSTSVDASGDLRYPLSNDGSYDYLKISTFQYDQTGIDSASRFLNGSGLNVDQRPATRVGPTIVLPMQPGISDSNSVDWGSDQLNPLQVIGARMAAKGISELSQLKVNEAASKMFTELKKGFGSIANDVSEGDILAYFAGQAVGANIFTRATGKVINPNLELLFRGPQLRSFNYNYTFTPRNDKESVVVRQIIRHFKKNMAVKKRSAGLFLETPNIFDLKYIYSGGGEHPFLNKIKRCALTNFNVEYTPDGSYMTYKDGSMTSYTVSMQFSELTPIYEEDYNTPIGSQGMGY